MDDIYREACKLYPLDGSAPDTVFALRNAYIAGANRTFHQASGTGTRVTVKVIVTTGIEGWQRYEDGIELNEESIVAAASEIARQLSRMKWSSVSNGLE